ncbi:MAG: hypothetical protein ABI867_28905 [Kofleriaceae bacterium]
MRAIALVLIGCGSSSSPAVVPVPPAPIVIDAGVPLDAPEPIDAAIATVDPAPAPLAFDPKPPAKGGVTKLAVKETATVGGVTVTFVSSNHKHPAGRGRTLGMWSFTIARDGAKSEVEVRSTDDHPEAEIDAKGVLLVLRHVDYYNFEIVLAAAKTPKPLSEEACVALVAKAAVQRGLPGESSSMSSDLGIVHAGAKRWDGHCGSYTRRVWFTPNARDWED